VNPAKLASGEAGATSRTTSPAAKPTGAAAVSNVGDTLPAIIVIVPTVLNVVGVTASARATVIMVLAVAATLPPAWLSFPATASKSAGSTTALANRWCSSSCDAANGPGIKHPMM
jgi:hypothetical protein